MGEARWFPGADVIAAANLTDAMSELGLDTYDDFYTWSAAQRGEFWGYTTERLGIVLSEPATVILNGTPQHPGWLAGATPLR